MCKACDLRANALLKQQSSAGFDPSVHFAAAAAAGKAEDGMLGTGHDLVPPQLNALIVTTDSQPGDRSTTATLTVGGPKVVSTIEAPNDEDFFAVTLEAGKTYEIGQYLTNTGPNGVPLADAYIELYDASGKLIVSADGGGPNTPSGLDALLTFTPETSGVYYVDARSYDQDPTNGTKGDFVGDYEVFVREASAFSYKPYYDVNSPLHSLDWGTQVDGSSRNPDGAEGPRPTGNPFTGHAWNPYGISGKNVVYYYFAKQGEVFVSEDPANPGLENMVAAGFRDWEKKAYELALDEFEKVADIVYIEVQNRDEADFTFITYDGTPNVGILGRMSPPDTQNEGQTEFNRNGPGWNEAALKPGGFSFTTLLHELGHGHGLAHPHDNGGRSGIMRGVQSEGAFDYSTGDFNLNQGVFTIMSYEDAWRPESEGKNDTNGDGQPEKQGLRPAAHGAPPTSSTYGWVGSLSPFDIAVLQDKYGVNEEWATGNDTYVLKDANVDGTFYQAIWDAGGIDSIVYDGARAATIDLRAATLKYEFGGGGNMSYALGIHGGFTIANGVTIENARGGSGNDVLIGNGADNILDGRGGSDSLSGGAGNDAYMVDRQADSVFENANAGYDTVYSSVDYRLAEGQSIEFLSAVAIVESTPLKLTGNSGDNLVGGNYGNNELDGGTGSDTLVGQRGHDTYFVDGVEDIVYEAAGEGYDTVYARGDYALTMNQSIEFLSAVAIVESTPLKLVGNNGDNLIGGNYGNNELDGGTGSDTLVGQRGDDTYFVDGVEDIVYEAAGEGYDTVYARGDYALTMNQSIEFLSAVAIVESTPLKLVGNNSDNLIGGNYGNNVLDGGTGSDTLVGQRGDDTYFVDGVEDIVYEATGEGYDTVYARGDFTLTMNQSIEVLSAAAILDTSALRLTGNNADNIVGGNNGNNVIDGGLGRDYLVGHGGADTFLFSTTLGGDNIDRIEDFQAGLDKIGLSSTLFGLGVGNLAAGAFRVGSAAGDADDRIIYDPTTGALLFDADGAGGAAAVQFATLNAGLNLTVSDFAVL